MDHSPDSNLEKDRDILRKKAITSRIQLSSFRSSSEGEITSENKYNKILSFLLNIQNKEGWWGSDDNPIWKEICTAQVIQLLLRLGLPTDFFWEISTEKTIESFNSDLSQDITFHGTDEGHLGGIRIALQWLEENPHTDFSWGQDFWDSCQVVKTFLIAGYSPDSRLISSAISHLKKVINDNWESECQKDWFGPGFFAGGVEVFSLIQDQAMVELLIGQIWKSQVKNGSFPPPKEKIIPAEWHTSQVLIALNLAGLQPYSPKLKNALEWIGTAQAKTGDDRGSWGKYIQERSQIYYTAWPVIAFSIFNHEKSSSYIDNAINWLSKQQKASGRIGDIPSTIATALAFSYVFPAPLVEKIPFKLILDTQNLISRQDLFIDRIYPLANQSQNIKKENENLKKELAEQKTKIEGLNNDIKSYLLRLKAKDVALLGLFCTIISVIFTVLCALANFFSNTLTQLFTNR